MRVVFMGSPDFAVPSLQALILNRHEVAAVYTQEDKPAGRGRSTAAPAVKEAALVLGLTVVQPHSLKTPEVVARLEAFHPDAIVVAAYGKILPPSVLKIPRYGCMNVHPSLLPRFRGASPVAAAILAGDDFAGVSIMLMDAGMDTGPVLMRAQVAVSPQDTAGSLTARLAMVGARLLQNVLVYLPRGEIVPQPQELAKATRTSPIVKESGKIDWQLSAVEIWRHVRAFQPWPGSYTFWQGKQLKINEAVPLPEGTESEAGKVVELENDIAPCGVVTGNGILGICQLQLEGKKAMSAVEFIRGQRGFIGSVLSLC